MVEQELRNTLLKSDQSLDNGKRQQKSLEKPPNVPYQT